VGEAQTVVVRPFDRDDFDAVVEQWHETNLTTYTYVAEHQRHTLADAKRFFGQRIVPSCRIWVAAADRRLVGVIALRPPWIEQLAVFSGHRRSGVGTRLLEAAREHSPVELRAFTFQRNIAARTFYERHGFVAVAFGVSPSPESEPDVEYRWVA
jgi:putative acetyltransferase